jgi:biopolymer transport protein ExbB/TolQ
LIQEELSNIVYGFNTSVSNLLLAGMTVALVWFGYVLSIGAVAAYVSSSKSIRKALAKRVASAPARLRQGGEEAFLRAEFKLTNRRLAFAKTMGPALGFLLTVSSLSAALHPSVQATQDTFRFVSGIQIAVIATFIGLAIRIVAHWAQRVYVDLAERLLLLLADEQGDAAGERGSG